jgi:hypothetical protein
VGWIPGHDLVVVHGARDSRLRRCDDTTAHRHSACDTDLTGEDRIIAHAAAARDSNLRGDDAASPDSYVVGDLNQIVDLCACTDDRLPECRAVDRGVCPNLDVMLDDHPAEVRNLNMALSVADITEAVITEHYAAVHKHAVSEVTAAADYGTREEVTIFTDHGTRADVRVCLDDAPRTNAGAAPDDGMRANLHIGPEYGVWINDRRRVDPGSRAGGGVESVDQFDELEVRAPLNLDLSRADTLDGHAHENRRGWRGLQLGKELLVLVEGDVVTVSSVDSSSPRYRHRATDDNLPPDNRRNLL